MSGFRKGKKGTKKGYTVGADGVVELSSYKKESTGFKWCYESHPALKILVDGKTYKIYGGSCCVAPPEHIDIFIGFDYGMQDTVRVFPWEEGHHIYFNIKDMYAPEDKDQFKRLIEWTAEQLMKGKIIYAGCIGGHGRTGTFFAALVTHMTGNVDSIIYVRENYCKKVVESQAQIEFLHKHYGITKVTPTKGVAIKSSKLASPYKVQAGGSTNSEVGGTGSWYYDQNLVKKANDAIVPQEMVPVKIQGQIHGKNKVVN